MTTAQKVKQIQTDYDINPIFAKRLVLSVVDKQNEVNWGELIKNRPKPFVKWVGGKRQLLAQFRQLDLYPPEQFNPLKHHYFEPFVGGGAVFFDLLPQHATLSDMNAELVTTYLVVRDKVEELIKSLKKHQTDKDYFLKIRSQDVSKLSDVQIASRFIFLNRTAFNGLYRVNKKGEFNVPYGKYANPTICDETNLRRVSSALQGISIKHQDYKVILRQAKKGDFIYFDPPYYPVSKTASFTSYTKESFLDKEQTELRDVFMALHKRGCFVMLSNSYTPFILDLYRGHKGVRVSTIQASRNVNSKASGRGKIAEVLVTNY